MSDHRALQIVTRPEQTSTPPSSPPRAKYIEACARKAWALHLWRKAERPSPSNRKILRYTCRAWRHEGACARWRASVDYKRISDALEGHPVEDVLYLVLTFPDRGDGSSTARKEAYKRIWRGWQSLRQAITRGATLHGRRRSGRRWSAQLWGRTRVAYVAIVEQHRRDQWPHLNVILVGRDVARAFASRRGYCVRWIKSHAQRMGWGHKALWAEPLLEGTERRIREGRLPPDAVKTARTRLAGYVMKILGLDIVREVTKLNQAPIAAPHRFRRLRYGPIARNGAPGFLAVRHKDPAWTGQLERYPLAELADRLAHWDAINARHGWTVAPEDGATEGFWDPAHRPRGPPVTFFASLSRPLRVRYWTLRRQLGLSPVPRLYRPPGPPWAPIQEDYE